MLQHGEGRADSGEGREVSFGYVDFEMFRRYLAAWPEAQRTRQREVSRIDRGEKSVLVKRPEHGAQAEENREKARLPKQGRRGFPEFET